MNLTVDASVFVAALQRTEAKNSEATLFLARAEMRGHTFQCPVTLLVEVACAVARASRDPARGRVAMHSIRELPFLTLTEISESFASSCGELGAEMLLRAGDAFYPAVAFAMNTILITYDIEMRERSRSLVKVQTPAEWLVENE